VPARHPADVHAVGTGGHIVAPPGTSADLAFGSGEEGSRHLVGSGVESLGTAEVSSFGDAPEPTGSFGGAPTVTALGSAPQPAMFSHPTPDQETFGPGPAHLIPTGDDGSPESPFADRAEQTDTSAPAASHAVGDEFDPGHHAAVFHDPDGTLV
jgi:hypothetical protein